MDNSNKIKPLSKKIAAFLIKNEIPSDFEKSEILGKKTKTQMLSDIRKGARLGLLKSIEIEKDWKTLQSKLNTPVRKLYYKYAAAASVLIIVALTVFLNKGNDIQFTEPLIVNNNIEVGSNKATLTLADGSDVTLRKGTDYQTASITSNGEEIAYKATNQKLVTSNQKLITTYNTLTIPRGAQFQIKLSDGTKVWLNSESQLRYPVAFNDGDTRRVELVYGEAYFDVSPSTDHKGAKFKVINQSQEVEVLGTEFNIKAYKDETNIYTTLVEGKVAVSNASVKQNLVPNQQLNLNSITNSLTISEVDVNDIISWKEGVFNFKRMPLKDIMKVLSRWYDMDVVFENKDLEAIVFTGVLGKDESIEEILSALKYTNFINGYEINNKKLIIK